MQIEVTTDGNVAGSRELIDQLEAEVETSLARFSSGLTRVEVHLGDANAEKAGPDDKRCMLEARLAGQAPIVVTNHDSTIDGACAGALKKLRIILERRVDKHRDHKGGTSIRHAGGD